VTGEILEVLVFEIFLVRPLFPAGEVLFSETFAVGSEVLDDLFVGQAFIEQVVDGIANGLGKAGDFVGAIAAARFEAEDFGEEVGGVSVGRMEFWLSVHNLIFLVLE
jgi:hypothetical protein